MPPRKVYATANDENQNELTIATDDHGARNSMVAADFITSGNATKSAPRLSSKMVFRSWRRFYRRTLRPLVRSYRRLPWTTRQTISVTISLYATMYIFVSVPFRIAFYYNPFTHTEMESVNRWAEELSVFVVLDIVADFIGLVEFISFYRVWKDSFSQLSASVSYELGKKLTRDAKRLKAPRVLRHTSSTSAVQHGKAKWTLASIRPLSSMPGGGAEDTISQRKYKLMRNVEFALEIFALIPMEAIPYASGACNALHLARINKLCRLYRLQSCFERIASIYSDRAWIQHISSTGIDTLVRNIILCAGLCHWVACGYMLIAHAQCGISLEACHESEETSWVIRDHLSGASVARKYARALYWASRTTVLLGYDDVTPVSDAETIYAVVATIIGALFGSSLLATFLFIFRFRNARYAAFATHVDNSREYMRSQNIPRVVRQQVSAYFNYAWSTHHSLDSEEALLLMPGHLQSKVTAMLKASRIKQVCFLMKESVEFVNLLALALVRRVYSPGDQVTEPKFNTHMFFVIRGKVVLSAFDGSNPKDCQTGDFFADSCLLFPDRYEENAVAKTFCELYVLAKAKFDEALTHFHRGDEPGARTRMIDILEKYSTQVKKTKRLLGLRGGHEHGAGGSQNDGDHIHSDEIRHGVSWRLPGSIFRVHWDTARMLAIVYVAFEVPFFSVFIAMTDDQNMFVDQPEFGVRYALTLLVELFFTVDLLLRSRRFAYLDQSVMLEVEQPDLIFAAYRGNGFYLDLLAWIPVGMVLDSLTINVVGGRLSLLRLLRLLRVREVPSLLRKISDNHNISSKVHLVVSLILGVTLMLHVVGCVWFEMAWIARGATSDIVSPDTLSELTRGKCLHDATHFQNCTWVKFDCYANVGAVYPLQDPTSMYNSSFAYLRSVYWAIVTLTAVGYGDITAYSTAESYFAALWIFVGGIINFGVVGAMSSTISNVMSTRHHHIEKLNTVNSILERMDISQKLSGEIRRFYRHQYLEHKHAYESQLLSYLPDQLCYQISSLLHSEAVKSVPLFDSATTEFLHEITGKFRHRSYQHGETICLEGDISREFFVLLHGSKINMFFHLRRVPTRALHEGDCYGVSEFLLRRAYSATLIAASLVHTSVMNRDQFDVIQRKFADDLSDMKDEAQSTWKEEHIRMRCIVQNLDRLKMQTHMLHTPTLFCQHEAPANPTSGNRAVHDLDATRSTFSSAWNAIITCWNIYNVFFVIFRICFHSHLHFSSGTSTVIWITDLTCDFCFAVDIYLRLFYFGCPEVGFENLLERNDIDSQYRRSSTFKWDLAASLPLYAPVPGKPVIASLCRLPRLIRCVDLWVYLDDVIVQIQQHFASQNVSAYLSPMKLLIILLLVTHVSGCIFFLISDDECKRVERCWMTQDHMIHEYHHSVPMLYAKSFYWAITTLLLVGSRDIVPRDATGTIWTGFTCLCCTFIIGHIVGEISEMILELGKETKQYKNRIASFESFAKEHNLTGTLRERVSFFFRLQFQHTEGIDLHNTVHDLSANLRLKFMLEIYAPSIMSLPISRFLASSQINNLALRLQSELFIPGDTILVEGTFGNRLCIMRKGLATAFWTRSVTSVSVVMEGALFGEVAFFVSSQRRLATVRATSSCEVLYITKHDWQELWTTNGDLSDTQVQKHALYSILDWVQGRLRRYQRRSLCTANKAKRLIIGRQTNKNTASLQARLSFAPSTVQFLGTSKGNDGQSIINSDVTLLEKKTKYLLAKTDALSDQFRQALASLYVRRRVSSMASNRSTRLSFSQNKSRGPSSEMYRSTIGDATSRVNSNNSDIHSLQFIVDLNPLNKLVRDSMSSDNVRRLETESWARFKILAAAQHTIGKLLDELIPPEVHFSAASGSSSGQAEQRPHIKIQPSRGLGKRQASYSVRSGESAADRNRATENHSAAFFGMTTTKNRNFDSAVKLAMVAQSIGSTGEKIVSRRRFSVVIPQEIQQHYEKLAEFKIVSTTARIARSYSLPLFDEKYFEISRQEGSKSLKAADGQALRASIDFDMLQRCQRPQYATQLRLYHRYRRWKNLGQDANSKTLSMSAKNSTIPKRLSDVRPMNASFRGSWQLLDPSRRSSNGQRLSLLGPKFQFASDHAQTIDPQSKEFIRRIKELGRAWDLVMLAIAVYHLLATPFKLCFAHELTELHGGVLRAWSGTEMFMDVLCAFDVGYKIRYPLLSLHSMGTALGSAKHGGFRRAFLFNPALRADILAMFPLELLLFANAIRVPLRHKSPDVEGIVSWWTTRWLLRMNRILLVRRIEPLSEQLFQYLVYERKLHIGDAMLYFFRALMSYLTMGHLLACIWFITSKLGLFHYGTSWLSTSGMLTFIPTEATEVELSERMLSESTTTFDLESVSISRKYLRSLLFSMECISTLFNGDIISMNLLEFIAEIISSLWSIYIYGALVGAQGELLNARAKSEAAFEQRLGELQHYLIQNGVSKKLKRQIKAYYARIWRRRKGEEEFAAVSNVSRKLYEDVVLATLRGFAARVVAFHAFDEHFLRGLLVCLQYVVCSEDEEVTVKGDVDRSMYFIAQGRILVKLDSAEAVRERGEFFGELSLLYGISRLETCVALTLSELYRLDYQPYERLLQDFPEYSEQNKLAWTQAASPAPDRAMLEAVVRSFQLGIKRNLASFQALDNPIVPTLDIRDVVANAERINADLPHSHIYKFIMKLLAQLNRIDPLEARDLVLHGRAGARKHLKAILNLITSRDQVVPNELVPPIAEGNEIVTTFRARCEEESYEIKKPIADTASTRADEKPNDQQNGTTGSRILGPITGAFAKQGTSLNVLSV